MYILFISLYLPFILKHKLKLNGKCLKNAVSNNMFYWWYLVIWNRYYQNLHRIQDKRVQLMNLSLHFAKLMKNTLKHEWVTCVDKTVSNTVIPHLTTWPNTTRQLYTPITSIHAFNEQKIKHRQLWQKHRVLNYNVSQTCWKFWANYMARQSNN